MTRTDCHCPSQIVPTDYRPLFFFNFATAFEGFPVKAHNVDRLVALRDAGTLVGPVHESSDQCDICGAVFVWGEAWAHEPTGHVIKIGHQCAEKYRFYAEGGATGMAEYKGRQIAQAEREAKARNAEIFLNTVPGLAEALELDHGITRDLKRNLLQWGSLTERQVDLAFKLQKQQAEYEARKAAEAEETWIDAPQGRVEVQGTILSVKWRDSQWGGSLKMLVKVETEAGAYKAWGSVPDVLCWQQIEIGGQSASQPIPNEDMVGRTVAFTATVQPMELGFGFFKRPSKARYV